MSVRVLVVDDEPAIRELCRVSLELRGYDVDEAPDGLAAIERAREARPDVVLLDVMMPKLDGWGVLAALGDDPALRGLPVVLMTALSDDADRQRAEGAGAAWFVAKPFDPQELVDAIEVCTGVR